MNLIIKVVLSMQFKIPMEIAENPEAEPPLCGTNDTFGA